VERRTLPGETEQDALADVYAACARVQARRPDFRAETQVLLAQKPSDVSADAPIVNALRAALDAGVATPLEGMSAWTDAALLNEAGIPAICFGPGDIALAHAAEEYIPVEEIERATAVLATLARSWCGGGE
jgi:acetylornithine deacetylase